MQDKQQYSFSYRLYRAAGPLLGGILLDVMDLITFGPIGLFTGWLLGGLTAYWIGSFYNISTKTKIWMALLGALYCTIPATEIFPLATILAVICRFFENPNKIPEVDTSNTEQAKSAKEANDSTENQD